MTACIRIYTLMGKENCKTVNSFVLHTEQYSDTVRYILEIVDEAEVIDDINSIVQGGGHSIHIRYVDDDVEAECAMKGCSYCDITGRIETDKPDIKIIRYTGDRLV